MNMYLMIGAIISLINLFFLLTTEVKGFDNAVNDLYHFCQSKLSVNLILAMYGIIAACIDFFLWPIVVIYVMIYVVIHRIKRSIK